MDSSLTPYSVEFFKVITTIRVGSRILKSAIKKKKKFNIPNTRLLVGADEMNSPVRSFANIDLLGWDYNSHL
ncbi:hypothetical protein C1645_833619 [Glomus cerebriforme]|uniref:Uncharacterized protein n=1 Tax=Glomus cerebriforme TaxID=658196 RepID=A0A397SL83_9GLOM|nr:hypothetical protein C1645_833619 [Glomus cerebriforme]